MMAEKTIKPYILREERVIDEIYWNLSNVQKAMDIDQLHDTIGTIIRDEDLPVNLDYLDARWKVDEDETRKRIMVSLKDHLWRNIRILIGLDYMGKRKTWLQIQMILIDDPYFTRILMPKSTGAIWAILGILLLMFGALYRLPHALVPIAAGLSMIGWYAHNKHIAFAKNRERYQQIDKFITEIGMKSSRTFKMDDVRLFAGAMKKVIKMTIDSHMNDDVEVIDTVVKGGDFWGSMGSGTSSSA